MSEREDLLLALEREQQAAAADRAAAAHDLAIAEQRGYARALRDATAYVATHPSATVSEWLKGRARAPLQATAFFAAEDCGAALNAKVAFQPYSEFHLRLVRVDLPSDRSEDGAFFLLFISKHALANEAWQRTASSLLQRRLDGRTVVVPVCLDECRYLPLADICGVPSHGKSTLDWSVEAPLLVDAVRRHVGG